MNSKVCCWVLVGTIIVLFSGSLAFPGPPPSSYSEDELPNEASILPVSNAYGNNDENSAALNPIESVENDGEEGRIRNKRFLFGIGSGHGHGHHHHHHNYHAHGHGHQGHGYGHHHHHH